MSMTFLLGLFYSLYQVTDKFSIKGVFITLLWALIATISNLALINIWLIVICWLLLLLILKKENYPFRKRIIPFLLVIVISLFSTVFFAVISFKARELGLLYTGGAEGFNAVTLKSLLLIFIGVDFSEAHYILGFYFILLLEYTVYKVCIQHVFFQRTVLSFIFLAGNLIAYWLLHGIFGVNYPENRVVVYLLPVFLIALGFSLDDLMAMTGKRIFLFLLLPFLILPAIFPLKINFTTTESYFKDPVSVEFYNKIANEQLSGDYPPTVGGHRLYLLCWSYLDYINNGTQSALSWQDYPGKIADFQIIDKKELPLFHNDYRVVGEYNESSRYLMKRVHPIKKQLIIGQKGIHTEDETNFEYFNLFIANVDSLVGRSLYIGFKGKIQSIMVPFEAWIVADVKDAAGNSMRYVNYGLNWHKNSWQGGSSYIKNGLILHDLPSGSVTLVLYLWNINKAPFRIENFECTLFRYSE